ncbi:SRPBCC family protein [Oceanicoccus sp. KOV_DT_Chl]|uniref:SRPBCC family protein n=1 Tax=Oceanicoccus sp. KOV_DT_Chl TaxID=1904639 RepID=UPI000C7D286F|nr:SRPBCC family protein [Oceanicoccus sp. KOV_DT_Chl]
MGDPIQKVEWTSPKPFAVGTTRTVYMSGGLVGEEEFIAWEPGKRMAFCFTAMSQDSTESFAEDYQVTDLGNGSCKVVWVMAMEPKGFSKIVLTLFGPLMAWFNRRMFKNFRRYVEQQAAVAVAG